MAITLLVKTRKQIMKDAGLYTGKVDNKKDSAYWEGICAVNLKYLPRRFNEIKVYPETDIVLRNLRSLKAAKVKNFTLDEFKCGCRRKHCCGYPTVLSKNLLMNLQDLRDEIGPMTITSGLRCKEYNASLDGSSTVSGHLKGLATDFCGKGTDTEEERKEIIREWLKKPYANYAYSDTPNMYTSVHVQVKK